MRACSSSSASSTAAGGIVEDRHELARQVLFDHSPTPVLASEKRRLSEARSGPTAHLRMLTARAITSATVTSETSDWASMVSFAHRDNGMTSVGLNAVALVNDRYR